TVLKTNKLASMLAIFGLAIGLTVPSYGDDATAFTRFKDSADEGSGALQIAQASYRHPKKDVEIVLYGVVHIADKAYFEAVQKDLDNYTIVLWEGVKPGKKPMKDNGPGGIGEMQQVLCDVLGLTFQK